MPRILEDLSHAPTLGYLLMTYFHVVAPRVGVRLEAIEDDANEHSLFWQEVARAMLDALRSSDVQ